MGKNFCKIGSKWCKFCRRGNCDFSHTPTESLANCPRIEAIKTTNLSTLVNAVNFEDVFTRLCMYFPSQTVNRNGYEDVFNLIKTFAPKEMTNLNDLFIVVDACKEDDDDHEYLNVSGISLSNPDKYYGIEFTPWRDWVSMNITKETLNTLSKEDIVAGCLYEMTFFGWTEDEPQQKLQELKDSIEECKKQTESK